MAMVSFWVSFAARSIRLDDKVVKAQIWDTTAQERFSFEGKVLHSYEFYVAAQELVETLNLNIMKMRTSRKQ